MSPRSYPEESLLGGEQSPGSRERWKSSLLCEALKLLFVNEMLLKLTIQMKVRFIMVY